MKQISLPDKRREADERLGMNMPVCFVNKWERKMKMKIEYSKMKEELKKMCDEIRMTLKNAPKGNLRISSSAGRIQYYHLAPEIKKEKPQGMYIRKSERKLAQAIAQRDYDRLLLREAERLLNSAETDPQCLDNAYSFLGSIFCKQNTYRQDLIVPRVLPDNAYIEKWLNEEYKQKAFSEDAAEIYTQRRERVRSKSEKIIADCMNQFKIPYRYEKPLKLGNMTIYPDFTILDRRTRSEMYWEHMGMMDNAEYAQSAVRKMNSYEKCGMYSGEQVLFSFETAQNPLDTRLIEDMVKHYFVG